MTTILIVEDDLFIRELAELVIHEWGYHTLSASDGDEALLLLRSPQPIDMLFTDIYLKSAVLGGCELADQAITLRPLLRVLYTTGNSINEKMKSRFTEGSYFLRKPYTMPQLKSCVETLFAA